VIVIALVLMGYGGRRGTRRSTDEISTKGQSAFSVEHACRMESGEPKRRERHLHRMLARSSHFTEQFRQRGRLLRQR